MKTAQVLQSAACLVLLGIAAYIFSSPSNSHRSSHDEVPILSVTPVADRNQGEELNSLNSVQSNSEVIYDENFQLCQGYDHAQPGIGQIPQAYGSPTFGGGHAGCSSCLTTGCNGCDSGGIAMGQNFGYSNGYGQTVRGVNGDLARRCRNEPTWKDAQQVPFEEFAYGEYIGPHRTPHVPIYRLRVNDQVEFVYLRTREKSLYPYQLFVGDTIAINSAIDPELNQPQVGVLSDGFISLSLIGQVQAAGKTVKDLQAELNDRYSTYVKNPAIVVQVTSGNTPLLDLIDSVDARAGQGGQVQQSVVSPDGTVQLPGIGSIPAIGLTLDEVAREVNARYRLRQGGIEVTPRLLQRAPRAIYVLGQVAEPGRFELTGPTTVLQALALAQGTIAGGNERQIIIFRRDQDWRLVATKVDLKGALLGKKPYPSDDLWLRDSDIVLVPRMPIQRASEAVNLYFTNTLYSLFPNQLGLFDAGAVIN
ncbi:MAG: polysaccharide biosynthesis/export family protein [Planctomycetota bacterium]